VRLSAGGRKTGRCVDVTYVKSHFNHESSDALREHLEAPSEARQEVKVPGPIDGPCKVKDGADDGAEEGREDWGF
jgi:hypothetical protein